MKMTHNVSQQIWQYVSTYWELDPNENDSLLIICIMKGNCLHKYLFKLLFREGK
jgi:hypothetical protein